MSKVMNPTKVITGKRTVMSYLNVNEPKAPMGGGTPKYMPSRRHTTKASPSSRVTASSYRHWRTSRLLFATGTRSAKAMTPTPMPTS